MSSLGFFLLITILFKTICAQKYNISRHYQGDLFTLTDPKCRPEDCHGNGRRASSIPWVHCQCQCLPSSPVFRQDLGQCVGTINECGEHMAVFVSPAFSESIPFVVLPEVNGVVYPSAEISLTDPTFTAVGSNLCVLTYLRILQDNGWEELEDLRLTPQSTFKAVGDDGKLFLQFSGDDAMRKKLSSSLVKVDVTCQRHSAETSSKIASKYCIIFRVAEIPVIKTLPSSTRSNDFVIIGLCAGLLGVTYVGAMLIYLLVRWQKRQRAIRKGTETSSEDSENVGDKDSPYEFVMDSDESRVNSEIVNESVYSDTAQTTRVERAPMTGLQLEASTVLQMRRRLVFDPSFLELDLLDQPPPAAVEFLTRIREMIGIARNRIRSCRFLPSLGAIAEEGQRVAKDGLEEQGCDNEAFEDDEEQNGIDDDDRFTFLARIPEDHVLTDSYDGLYDFESFRLEMVKKMQKKRREQMKKKMDGEEEEEWTVDEEIPEGDEDAIKDSLDPLQGSESGIRFSRSQMLKKVNEEENIYDSPPMSDMRAVSTYLFGEPEKKELPPTLKKPTTNGIAKTIADFSPPKLDKVRRKVFGDSASKSHENGGPILVEDPGYHSSENETNKNSIKKNNSSFKSLHRLLALKSPSSRTETPIVDTSAKNHQVSLGNWLNIDGNEELVKKCDGLKDGKTEGEFSEVSFVSTMNLDEEVDSSESDYADSLEGTPVLR